MSLIAREKNIGTMEVMATLPLKDLDFVIGKFLLGLYFGETNPGSTYGAAGTIVLVLLWVSYSCLILFFGAQFTYIYAKKYNILFVPYYELKN